jgi:2-polyprenyl-3-methyl-5-hydroxy-6-metoxy-1,4-benzoquinol methylase
MLCGRPPVGPIVWSEPPYEAVLCTPCGLVETRPAPPFEDTLERLVDQHGEAFYAAPARWRARWLRGVAPEARDVLEVGCGEGHQLDAFRALGFTPHGVEAMPERVARARARGHPVQGGFIERLTPEPAYDVVYHTDLLSHVEDPVAWLRHLSAYVRRPCGVIAFEVGALLGDPSTWATLNANPGLHVHRRFFTPAALERVLTLAGLELVSVSAHDLTAYVHWLRCVAAARRLRGARPGPGAAGTPGDTPNAAGTVRQGAEWIAAWLRYGPASRVVRRAAGGVETRLVAARPR